MDDFYATVPYINQTDPFFGNKDGQHGHSLIYFYPRVPTRHEYNYLMTLTLTRVPTWHE